MIGSTYLSSPARRVAVTSTLAVVLAASLAARLAPAHAALNGPVIERAEPGLPSPSSQPAPQPSGGSPTGRAEHPVGVVDASFDVSTSGAATYTIPIKVPPGTLGVEPRLSLVYNSQAGNDLAGVGFALTGLSRIERCAPTIAQDGWSGSVAMNDDDRFCLDGLRLMVESSSTYGADGAVYHTENETWSRVVSHGRCDGQVNVDGTGPVFMSGPCSFSVTLKDGTTVEYGDMSDDVPAGCSTAVLGQNGSPRLFWPMTSLTDARGNRLTVRYSGSHYCYPERIDYTKNMRTGAPARRAITFEYGARADVVVKYDIGGLAYGVGERLTAIKTFVDQGNGDELVKQYRFDYELGGHTLRSRLTAVRECDAAGICLPATTFTWQNGGWMEDYVEVDKESTSKVPPADDPHRYVGDFNGDGKNDFVVFFGDSDSSGQWLSQLQPNGEITFESKGWYSFDPSPNCGANYWCGETVHTGDVNGDGYTDALVVTNVLWYGPGKNGWRLFLGGPDGLPAAPSSFGGPQPSLSEELHLGDFNGDGRADVLTFANKAAVVQTKTQGGTDIGFPGWHLYLWNGQQFVLSQQGSGNFKPMFAGGTELQWDDWLGDAYFLNDPELGVHFHVGDYNGDGRVDFVATKQIFGEGLDPNGYPITYTAWKLLVSRGEDADTLEGFEEVAQGIWPHGLYRVTPGDWNGDGLTDLMLTGAKDPTYWIVQHGYLLLTSTGVGFVPNFTQQQNMTLDFVNEPPQTIAWGSTGDEPDWDDAVVRANLNDDGLDDVVATLDPVLPKAFQYDGARLFASVGDVFYLAATIPYPTVDNPYHWVGDFTGTGRSEIVTWWQSMSFSGAVFRVNSAQTKPDLVTNVTDGIEGTIDLTYLPMTFDLYTKGSSAAYPDRDYISTRYLVRQVTKGDGSGLGSDHEFVSYYSYAGARTNLHGRGLLGFEQITHDTLFDGGTRVTEYRMDSPFAGLVKSQTFSRGPTVLSHSTFEYEDVPSSDFPGARQVRVLSERVTDFAAAQPTFTRGRDYVHYDAYGNIEKLIDRGDVDISHYDLVTETKYDNDAAKWRLGYPTSVKVYTDPAKPLSWKSIDYDDDMNVEYEGRWDSEHGQFLGTTQHYYKDGNAEWSEDPLGAKTWFSYDDFGFLETTTNPLGHVVGKKIDPRFGNEVERTDPNGNTVIITTDGFGRTTEIKGPDPNGQLVLLQRFRLTSIGAGFITQSFVRRAWTSSEWDWKEEFHDGLGRLYKTRKRGNGNQAIAVDREYHWFDLVGRATRPYYEGDAPQWIEYFHDEKRRVKQVLLPGNQPVMTVDYDDAQRLMVRTAPSGGETKMYLDPRGKLHFKIDPKGGLTAYAYDGIGRTTTIAAPGGATVTDYDSLGRKRSVTDSNSGTTTFGYDATGHLISETDAKGQVIVRGYDALDRTTSKTYYGDDPNTPTKTVIFTYDDVALANSIGELSHVESTAGGQLESAYDFAYDRYGRQASATLTIDGRVLSWEKRFDPTGNDFEQVYPDGAVLRTTFTSGGNPERLEVHEPTDAPGVFTTYATYGHYTAEGHPGELVYQNGVVSCWSYVPATGLLETARATRLPNQSADPCAQAGGTALLDYTYGWDDDFNVESITDKLDPARTQAFGYNLRGDLEAAHGIYGSRSYDYDYAGNMTTQWDVTYSYTGNHLMSGTDGLAASYDPNGNVETKSIGNKSWTFTWDADDQLVTASNNGVPTTFTYDFEGRRLKKTEDDGSVTYYVSATYEVVVPPLGPEVHTKYVPGPAGHVAQITKTGNQVVQLEQQNYHATMVAAADAGTPRGAVDIVRHTFLARTAVGAAGNVWIFTRSAALLATLLLALSTVGMMQRVRHPVAATYFVRRRPGFLGIVPVVSFFLVMAPAAHAALNGGANGPGVPVDGVFYFHSNHLGSSVLLTDPAGNTVARVEYDPYGNVDSASSSGEDVFRPKFTGKEWEPNAALYYYGERFYDPSVGRFISADTGLGGDPLTTASLNRYAYAVNNPITYVDPSGRSAEAVFAIVLVVGLVVGGIIGGTSGRIITDPAHAFDNWSWTRALVGAFIGLNVAAAYFGLGAIAPGVVVFGSVKVATLAQGALMGGVVSATLEWAGGERDGDRLQGYFGIGVLTGFLSSSNVFGFAKHGVVGKLASETATSLVTSSLKKAVDAGRSFGLAVWAFNISFTKDADVDFGANYTYLAGQAVGALSASSQGVFESAWRKSDLSFDTDKLSMEELGWAAKLLKGSYGPPPGGSLYVILGAVAKGVVTYATGRYLTATGSAQSAFDLVNFGADKGFDAAWGEAMGFYGARYDEQVLGKKK